MSEAVAMWVDGDVHLRVMSPSESANRFAEVRPLFERAAVYAPHQVIDWDEARAKVESGELLLLEVRIDGRQLAGVALELCGGNDGDGLVVRWLGGERMSEWLELLWVGLQDIARAYSCRWVIVHGRPGWAKALRPLGFKGFMWSGRAEVHQ